MTYEQLTRYEFDVIRSFETDDGEIVSVHRCKMITFSGISYVRRESPSGEVKVVWNVNGKRCETYEQLKKAIKTIKRKS